MSAISNFSIRRPIFVTMVSLIVIILGLVALMKLPVDMMPDVTFPAVTVSATYQDASPEDVEELVTRPIEEGVSAVPGVKEIRSSSSEGRSTVRVSFEWGTDIDAATNDVRDRIDRIVNALPDDVDRPRLMKFDAASAPVAMLGCASDLDPVKLRDFIEDQIEPILERVDGVGNVNILGGRKREIHVNLYPEKIKALKISTKNVLNVLNKQNLTAPAGTIDSGNYEVLLRTPGEYESLDEIRETVVDVRNGSTIRIKDIADVEDSWEKETTSVHINGKNGIRIMVFKQSDRNTVQVVRGVEKAMARINQEYPQINIQILRTNAEFINNSIRNVGDSAWQGGLLAVVVILFFLRNLAATFVIGTSIPISIIATFALIYFTGYTLNIMTLGGLALGVGMLVDNSIVVLENINRVRDEEKLGNIQAAEKGTDEVATPILASTLTTLVIFLPMFFVEGMVGIMFSELASVICFSLMSSYVTAITLVPMLTAQLGEVGRRRMERMGVTEVRHGALYNGIGRFLDSLSSAYRSFLIHCLHHWLRVTCIVVALVALSFGLWRMIGSEIMPETDESEIRVRVDLDVGTRVGITSDLAAEVERFIMENVPEYDKMQSNIGGSVWMGSAAHTSTMTVYLVKPKYRKRSSEEVATDLRKLLAGRYPGAKVRVEQSLGFFNRMMGGGADSRLEIDIRGYDMETGDELARQAQEVMLGIPGVTDVRISRESGTPEQLFGIDRTKASTLGLDVNTIADFLETSVAGVSSTNYREAGDEYKIVVKIKDSDHRRLDEIHDLLVTNDKGELINLRNVTKTHAHKGAVRIDRKDKERVVTLYCNFDNKDTSIGELIKAAQPELDKILRPEGFSIRPSGNWDDQVKTFRDMMLMFVLAIVLVYMVMACQYESLKDPFVVMFSVPLAAIGVLVMLFVTNTTINMESAIGCIMLAGIVVNNAIILVDEIKQLRQENLTIYNAILEAGRRRLRPILMTTLTTVLGLIPMALALGEGGESTAPLARAVIGGLSSSTLVTLIFIPIVYMVFSGGLKELKEIKAMEKAQKQK